MLLQSQIDALCHITHELLNLGFDGSPIYSDRFCELNLEVYRHPKISTSVVVPVLKKKPGSVIPF